MLRWYLRCRIHRPARIATTLDVLASIKLTCVCRTYVPMVCKNRKLAYIVNDALNSWVNNDKTSELISYAVAEYRRLQEK